MTGWSSAYTDSISGMFEGIIGDPTASNSLVLNTGTGSDIQTRLFAEFSMIAKAETEMTVTVHWLGEHNQPHSIELSETIDTD